MAIKQVPAPQKNQAMADIFGMLTKKQTVKDCLGHDSPKA
jgi:hypothetical protein